MKRSDLLVFRQQLPSVKGSTALGNMRIPRCQASPLWIFGRLVSSLKYYQTRGLNPRADDYVHNILYPGLLVKLFLLTNPQSPSPDSLQNSFLLWNREWTHWRQLLPESSLNPSLRERAHEECRKRERVEEEKERQKKEKQGLRT